MGKRKGNTAENRAAIRVHPGDSFVFDDERDFEFLTLLADEIQDDQVNVITEGLQLQKTLASSLMVYNSDEGEDDGNLDGKLSPESALVGDDSVAGEESFSLFGKTFPLIITYSDDSEEDENSAGKLAVEAEIFSDDYAVEEENRSFLEKAIDSGDTADEKIPAGKSVEEENSAAKSSPETALIPDHSAADEENWAFVEKFRLTSMKITDSTNASVASKSWPKTPPILPVPVPVPVPDDLANWAFLNELCQLCATEETLRRLIRVPGCGHHFCKYCFEWYTSTELGSESCLIKCPAETCFNQIPSDYCVALKLQNSLDTRDESISDWEYLDSQNFP